MTVALDDRRDLFTANGTATVFAATFPVVTATAQSDIKVFVKNDTSGAVTEQSNPSQFTITDITTVGFNVTFLVAPTSPHLVLILGREPRSFTDDFTIGSVVVLADLQNGLDKLERQIQELAEIVTRCLRFDKHSTKTDPEIGDPGSDEDDERLVWDNDTSKFVFATAQDASAITTTAFSRTILDDTTQAAVRTTLALTPDTDVPAQATYETHIANTTLHNKVVILTSPVNKVNLATDVDVAFFSNPIAISPQVTSGDVAKFAILRCRVKIAQSANPPNGTFRTIELRVRQYNSTTNDVQIIRVEIEHPPAQDSGGSYDAMIVDKERTIICPLGTLGEDATLFDYSVTMLQPLSFNTIQIWLEGYMT